MQVVELNALISWIEYDNLTDKRAQIVVKSLQQLDRFHLPHLFDLDIVEGFFGLWRYVSGRLLKIDVSLEHNDKELAIVSLRHLSQELDSSSLLPLH